MAAHNLAELDQDLLAKIKQIHIRAKHLVSDAFASEYLSAFKGQGMEFEEVREYIPGDDVRHIDWNVTARSDRPFIKTYRDERELTVMFLIDVSASLRWGSTATFKNEVAAEIAAVLAYAALKNNDKVGLIIFSDQVEHFVPPKKGRGHTWQIIRDILTFESEAKKTDLNVSLRFLNQVIKKKTVCFMISDFLATDYQHLLTSAARRHDLVAISLADPLEQRLPDVGRLCLEDTETGEVIDLDTHEASFRQRYQQQQQQAALALQHFFKKNRIDHLAVLCGKPYIGDILRLFKGREKMRVHHR